MKKYLVKSVKSDLTSYVDFDFKYPWKGPIEASDWKPTEGCGGGIHGIDENNFSYDINGEVYLIISYRPEDGVLELGDKIKIKKGEVVFLSKKIEKIQSWLNKKGIPYRGYGSVQKGGDYSTLTGGYRSTLLGGHGSTLTGGGGCTLTGGNNSTLIGENWCTLIGGRGSTLTGEYRSTLTGGDYCTLTGGNNSTLTGGLNSVFIWKYLDNPGRFRVHTEYVGEHGIKLNTPYKGYWDSKKNEFIVEEVKNEEE